MNIIQSQCLATIMMLKRKPTFSSMTTPHVLKIKIHALDPYICENSCRWYYFNEISPVSLIRKIICKFSNIQTTVLQQLCYLYEPDTQQLYLTARGNIILPIIKIPYDYLCRTMATDRGDNIKHSPASVDTHTAKMLTNKVNVIIAKCRKRRRRSNRQRQPPRVNYGDNLPIVVYIELNVNSLLTTDRLYCDPRRTLFSSHNNTCRSVSVHRAASLALPLTTTLVTVRLSPVQWHACRAKIERV